MNEGKRVLPRKILTACGVLLLMVSMSWAQDQSTKQDQTTKHDQAATEDETSTQNQSDIAKRIDASARVLDEIMATPDKGIPNKVMSDAKCIAVVPSMIKIAVGFGGSHGKGVATCRTAHGWSAPAPITITGGSWGLQLGGEAVDLVMVVMNQQGMQALLSSKFKIGANATASAGPVGRYAGADTNWKMKSEILTYSRSRGVFAGIDLNGAAVTQDKDETRVLYGKYEPFSTILAGKVRAKNASDPFLAAVRKYSSQSGDTHTNGPGY